MRLPPAALQRLGTSFLNRAGYAADLAVDIASTKRLDIFRFAPSCLPKLDCPRNCARDSAASLDVAAAGAQLCTRYQTG